MRQHVKSMAATLLLMGCSSGFSQEGAFVDITSAQPLVRISRQLAEKYGWVINFEDAPIASAKYTVETIDERGRTTVTARPSRISVHAQEFARLDDDSRRKLVQSVIDQANAAGGPTHYGYSMVGDIVRIFPKEVLSEEDGAWHSFTPLLDTRVSFPQGRYRIWRVMEMVLSEVERLRGVRISIGTVQPNLAAKEVVEGAIDEPAGLVLDRAFDAVNRVRLKERLDRLVFHSELAFWADGQTFFCSMDVAKRIEPPPLPPEPVWSGAPQGSMILKE